MVELVHHSFLEKTCFLRRSSVEKEAALSFGRPHGFPSLWGTDSSGYAHLGFPAPQDDS